MFVGQISLLVVIFLSSISRNLSVLQPTQEVNPHACIASCVSVFFFFLDECWCMRPPHHPGRSSGVDHTSVGDKRMKSNYPHMFFVLFHNVTCYTNYDLTTVDEHINWMTLRHLLSSFSLNLTTPFCTST